MADLTPTHEPTASDVAAAVPIRPAATVMLVRDAPAGGEGIEVFMLQRTSKAAFGPGMYVFPGGRVDGVDGADEIAPYCSGLDDATASAQLGIEQGGLAYWVAAVRECFEEAGVLLAAPHDGSALVLRNEDRHEVHDSSLSLVDLCRREDLVMELSTTYYVDHWITPLGEPRRFDTRFFITEMPLDQEPLHDDQETVKSLWITPAEALRQQALGDMTMMPPTISNLRFLESHGTAAAALAAGAAIEQPPCVLPKLRVDADGRVLGIALPTDSDYDDL